MGEGKIDFPQIPLERISGLKRALKSAKNAGIDDAAKRRESVIDSESAIIEGILDNSPAIQNIPSVAKPDVNTESELTKLTAINKYWEVNLPREIEKPNIIIDSPHSKIPNTSELLFQVKKHHPEATYDQVYSSFLRVRSGDDNNQGIDLIIKKLINRSDEYTDLVALSIGEKLKALVLTAKKPRVFSDANRGWFNRSSTKADENIFLSKEYSRSVRAAYYLAVRNHLEKHDLIKANEVIMPVIRFSIHGMSDVNDFDFAIAGNPYIADQEIIKKFHELLIKYLNQLTGSDNQSKVVIAKKDNPANSAYSGDANLSSFRQHPKKHLAQFPPFGENFSTIQLEISRRYRDNEVRRTIAINAISKAITELNV